MIVKSKRLLLYPISIKQTAEQIENEKCEELKKAYSEMLQNALHYPEKAIWYLPWYMELREKPAVIAGDFCFKGLGPDGTVEIGYGLRDGFCKKGYMTEALKTICRWALAQEGVCRIEAETAPNNTASQRVLLNAGFSANGKYGEEGPRYAFQNEKW